MIFRNICFVLLMLLALPVRASLDIEITGAGEHQIPISIVSFAGEEKLGQKISEAHTVSILINAECLCLGAAGRRS